MKRRLTPIKSGLTIFARGVLYLVTAAALAVCFILLPELAREELVGKPPEAIRGTIIFLTTAYTIAIPFFVGLYQAHKLLGLIDRGKAFSNESLKVLQNIKICAITFTVLVLTATIAAVILTRVIDPNEDAPPFALVGSVFTFIPIILAVFVALLQKLVAEAVTLKSENDLIV